MVIAVIAHKIPPVTCLLLQFYRKPCTLASLFFLANLYPYKVLPKMAILPIFAVIFMDKERSQLAHELRFILTNWDLSNEEKLLVSSRLLSVEMGGVRIKTLPLDLLE